ncbi:DUF3225 domain-containing protein [Opitutaceae bacterium EW11]|nr:DUF3225 domain-containing protein [Opitutaceae bacterium EW11]
MPDLNDPEVVAEIARLHDAYERALVANDVGALTAFFWSSPQAVRFGASEQSYGATEIAAFRNSHTPVFTDRRLRRREILAIGGDAASVMSEYTQKFEGRPRVVRQSQVWVRFPDVGWKIVSAHVSTLSSARTCTAR